MDRGAWWAMVHRVTKSENESSSVMSNSLQPHVLYSPWNSLGQNTGVGSLSLPQGIFQTQRSNPGLPHCRWILYQRSHKGSPRILEWGAYPFSRGSSQPRNQTGVFCIAGRFFTDWALREAQGHKESYTTEVTEQALRQLWLNRSRWGSGSLVSPERRPY